MFLKVTLQRWFSRINAAEKATFLVRLFTLRTSTIDKLLHRNTNNEEESRRRYEREVDRFLAQRRGEGDAYSFSSRHSQLVFVHERDLCFVSALRGCGDGWMVGEEGRKKVVFGIFGLAHLPGIAANWYAEFDEWGIRTVGDPAAWKATDLLYKVGLIFPSNNYTESNLCYFPQPSMG